ncbi:uncharacterized protein LOC111622068 [Centruroides sculpturatus]|uniref:uncharacterized protein LOC111622068 n=1 Tax=Centruroides sculpturatus TaxID=218467 RepID=UPI000C6E43FD|nr:uncharacterized protein LOC111622068 [Centruroides sculpturatus]
MVDESDEEYACSVDKQYRIHYKSRKKYVCILRSLQISIGVVTMIIGIVSATGLKESMGLFLFIAILCGFFMMEAALANLFILSEHSGENFQGWQEGIRKAGREGALCILASWACGIIFTIAMVISDVIVLIMFHDTSVTIIAYLELICGIFLLIIITVSIWDSITFRKVHVNVC